jgi:hypothetical protein
MTWRSRGVALVYVLVIMMVTGPDTLADVQQGSAARQRTGTWIARTSTGRTLAGTWTAAVNTRTGAVTGTWALSGPNGAAMARGGWSAAKSPSGWTGAWRAAVDGRNTEYAGTWSADLQLAADAPLAEMFARAAQAAVSGTWRAGRQSGQWSIRAAE